MAAVQEMKVQAFLFTAFLFSLLLGGNGCVEPPSIGPIPGSTMEGVWNAEPRHDVLSGQPVSLRLFFSRQRQDLLVVYDEYPKGTPPLRTRAYWLYESEDRLGRDSRVSFVKTNSAPDLVSVPMFSTTAAVATNSPETLCVVATNDYAFTVYSGQREVSSHDLPLHFVKSGTGTAEKIADATLNALIDGAINKLGHLGDSRFPP